LNFKKTAISTVAVDVRLLLLAQRTECNRYDAENITITCVLT